MTGLWTITAALTVAAITPALAGDGIRIADAYAVAASPAAKTGAAYLVIENPTPEDDRLIAARSEVAARTELHTSAQRADGVMSMQGLAAGIAIPAHGTYRFERGGDHIMFMGLTAPFEQGRLLPVTLIFERAGEIEIEIPVDLERPPAAHGAVEGNGSGG